MFQLSQRIPKDLQTGFPITQSVVDGSQEGLIYEYNNNFFIIHKSGFCSFIQHNGCLKELTTLFQTGAIPQYFHVYNVSEDLIASVQKSAELFNYKIRQRIQLQYREKKIVDLPTIEGFYCEPVNETNFETLSAFNLDLGHRFWNNRTDFINTANGMVVNKEYKPVCICYAAAIACNKAEVDVLTAENYRGKGIAGLAVAGFINKCLIKNIIPNWDCFADNIPSLSTAEKLGFISEKKYTFISIFKKNSHETH